LAIWSATEVALEYLVALLVDDLALVVGDVVVLEQLLADVEVARLDLALRASMLRLTMPASMASPSGIFRRSMMALTLSPAKMRISGSSSDR
jgi:ATP phosphoribosyltransferase regulatory subunit HisZ